ncbi:uncharacterized protein si:ch73-70k4.1 [Pristis pectinata]|uniref:uncharacterized protein si:ch73-70k4.1 n=1 Tax=Pristis pectinata TaxID=685728 RepID=UPI00223E5456|nr:uncharacterized protein si:ch73-70k4.1 [Pristis pectinata]
MAEERKLKLKRRRVAGPPQEPSPRLRRSEGRQVAGQSGNEPPEAERKQLPATVSTWLDDNDMNETDHIWALLMKSTFPDMKGSDWKTMSVPDLPLSSEKIPKYVEYVATETISVGNESFTWTPFPPVVALEERSRSESLFSHVGIAANKGELMNSTELHPGRSQFSLSEMVQDKDALSSVGAAKYLVVTKANHKIRSNSYQENVKFNDSFKADPPRISAEHARSKRENFYPMDAGDTSFDAPPGPATSLQRIDQEPMQPTPSTLKPSKGKTKQHKMAAGGTLCGEEGHSFPENRLCATNMMSDEGAVTKGSDGQVEGGLDLESCPMCLVRFPAGFTQLEVDSHLAKCLSESTEDVMW